jgi:hypothetical protein
LFTRAYKGRDPRRPPGSAAPDLAGAGFYGIIPDKTASAACPQERRQFGRITLSEPKICRIHLPLSQKLWNGRGIVMNISLGGMYFIYDDQPPLEQDDIYYVTFHSARPDFENHHF